MAVFDWTDLYVEKWRKAGAVNRQEIAEINAIVEKLILETPAYRNIPWTYKYGVLKVD